MGRLAWITCRHKQGQSFLCELVSDSCLVRKFTETITCLQYGNPHNCNFHRAGDWGMASNQNCYNETEPIMQEGYTGTGSDYRFMRIVEDKIEELKGRGVFVQMLNITQLSEYRKDGHPSIYRKQWDALREDQLANPSSYSDCTHWCLPGVPDVWNEILYAYIMSN